MKKMPVLSFLAGCVWHQVSHVTGGQPLGSVKAPGQTGLEMRMKGSYKEQPAIDFRYQNSRVPTLSPLNRVRDAARKDGDLKFTALLHRLVRHSLPERPAKPGGGGGNALEHPELAGGVEMGAMS